MTANATPQTGQPLVSFIITDYNLPASMLRECIDSILRLPLGEDEREIILVDDGSDISPLNELTDYRDSLIYLRQRNQGLSIARNVGIDICRGEYIQFVDGDDYLIREGYEQCLDVVRKQHPDMVIFNFTQSENGADTPDLFDGPTTGAEFLRHHNLRAAAWGYIFRKLTLVDLRFTPGLLHEDEEFTPQLILRSECIYSTDTCAYFYRVRPGSIVHSSDENMQTKLLNDTEYIINSLNHLANTLPSAERKALQRRVAQLSMDYIYNIITTTRSDTELEDRIERLRKQGLFPLPVRDYTQKYRLFALLTKYRACRRVMLRTLGRI